MIVTSGAAADEETASFLAGVLLLRLAGWLSHRPAPLAVVVATPGETGLGASPRGAAWFGRLLEDLRLAGADVIMAPRGPGGGQGGYGRAGSPPMISGGLGEIAPPGRNRACAAIRTPVGGMR